MRNPSEINVLIACEESQTVCKAFRALGFNAFSCDIIPCSGGHPEWHIKTDALEAIQMPWHLIIGHPPCTYLSKAGARWLYPKGKLNITRAKKGVLAKAFFMKIRNANCDYIALENPIPQEIYRMPKPTQIIQPWQFGHKHQKATGLWLKNLPRLKPTDIVDKGEFVRYPATGHKHSKWFMQGNARSRSKTFSGIADAMARQWGDFIINNV